MIPFLGELRLSLYEENHWRDTVRMLVHARARFGVNWLVTPASLASVETRVFELTALGCRDVLLLSYNGEDSSLHLSRAAAASLAERVRVLAAALAGRCELELDVCWGERMEPVPRLFNKGDCGAGREFITLTSDRRLMPCSVHHLGFPVKNAAEVLRVWSEQATELRRPARAPVDEDPSLVRVREQQQRRLHDRRFVSLSGGGGERRVRAETGARSADPLGDREDPRDEGLAVASSDVCR